MSDRYALLPKVSPISLNTERTEDGYRVSASADILGYDLAKLPYTSSTMRVWWDEEAKEMRWEPIDPKDMLA